MRDAGFASNVDFKREPYWEPLRKDPRYEKLLAEFASRDGIEIK